MFFATLEDVQSVKPFGFDLYKAANQKVLGRAAGKYQSAAAAVRDKSNTAALDT